ncbi:MAG: hypothetical protein H7Y22_15060 [Gemmatimonadaceae bacterium]|nr:hypothetical protein [Gloeobacterales cyanobacterium ES-bin-141]
MANVSAQQGPQENKTTPNTATLGLRDQLWRSLLTADMNARYYGHLARRYQKRHLQLSIFVAVCSSSTVTSWIFLKQIDLLWQVLSVSSALTSIALPILNWTGKVETMSKLVGEYSNLLSCYESLWASQGTLDQKEIASQFGKLKQTEGKIRAEESKLPYDEALLEKCQGEVLQSRGLHTEVHSGKK